MPSIGFACRTKRFGCYYVAWAHSLSPRAYTKNSVCCIVCGCLSIHLFVRSLTHQHQHIYRFFVRIKSLALTFSLLRGSVVLLFSIARFYSTSSIFSSPLCYLKFHNHPLSVRVFIVVDINFRCVFFSYLSFDFLFYVVAILLFFRFPVNSLAGFDCVLCMYTSYHC